MMDFEIKIVFGKYHNDRSYLLNVNKKTKVIIENCN